MVACAEILTAERKARNPCTNRDGETRIPPRKTRLHARSPVNFLSSPDCWRNRYARDPIGYHGGISLYGYVDSSPVGNADVSGLHKLPGVQKPVLIKIGARHSMPGGRYYVNYYYTQSLSDVLSDGENPAKLEGFKLAEKILNGLKSLSGVGNALVLIAKAINDNGAGRWVYMGTAFPEITKVYFCNGKLQSVAMKESRPTLWMLDPSEHGPLGGGFVLGPQLAQDYRFFVDLFHTTREPVKESGGE